MDKQEFIKAGFTVVDGENNENKLLKFLKENYPSVIKDNEINLQELKKILGLPVDEKVNGYGLNFVGRNVARAKYAQKTDKELHLNTKMSKNIDTTQNLVLKGDNLDCLKILKHYYSGKIKCIYIDPPYNTDSDEFVYPDKFDKEEAEVLGLVNLSDDDFARMEFAFKTKKSHNGWLSFMYPRLLLARDLLSDDGVIFISIDDNEQANLKLLCDEVFGEENFVTCFSRISKKGGNKGDIIKPKKDYILFYIKNKYLYNKGMFGYKDKDKKIEWLEEEFNGEKRKYYKGDIPYRERLEVRANQRYYIECPDNSFIIPPGDTFPSKVEDGALVKPKSENDKCWTWSVNRYFEEKKRGRFIFLESKNSPFLNEKGEKAKWTIYKKIFEDDLDPDAKIPPGDVIQEYQNSIGTKELKDLGIIGFDFPKPTNLIKYLVDISTDPSDFILDFFAGSGTTGHAVMQLNAEDGGNRKFILCQIDEPIKEDKPAYKFCKENNLPPVISSITIERLRRAGEKIKQEVEAQNSKSGFFEEYKKPVPDIGFKVFDLVDAPKLQVKDNGEIQFPELTNDPLSRIYNMIFTVGLDEPTQVPEVVKQDCIYKIGNHFYITNSEKLTSDDYVGILKNNGKMFIDGWTASLNGTLQNYKEDVKIVF